MASCSVPTDSNFRAHSYAIACVIVACPCCAEATPVVALCLPPGHEVLDVEEEDEEGGDAVGGGCWSCIAQTAFLFYVEELPDSVVGRMQSLCGGYRRVVSRETQDPCWANHCVSCDVPFEDYDLYCEPEGAFMPLTAAAAAAIYLDAVTEPLQVRAGGYAEFAPALELFAGR